MDVILGILILALSIFYVAISYKSIAAAKEIKLTTGKIELSVLILIIVFNVTTLVMIIAGILLLF